MLADAAFILGYATWRLGAAPAQAGHGPPAPADGLDPAQRLLRGVKVPWVENPAMQPTAAELAMAQPQTTRPPSPAP